MRVAANEVSEGRVTAMTSQIHADVRKAIPPRQVDVVDDELALKLVVEEGHGLVASMRRRTAGSCQRGKPAHPTIKATTIHTTRIILDGAVADMGGRKFAGGEGGAEQASGIQVFT